MADLESKGTVRSLSGLQPVAVLHAQSAADAAEPSHAGWEGAVEKAISLVPLLARSGDD